MLGLATSTSWAGNLSWGLMLRWGILSLLVILFLTFDLRGSTPVYKGSFFEDRLFKIVLDEQKCKIVGFCEQVCPKNCFEVDKPQHIAAMPRADQCIQCGACIVQCPFDALYFKTPTDAIIPPEIIRKFRLRLLGTRIQKIL